MALATFEQISLHPTTRKMSGVVVTRAGLAAPLDADHYDRLIDKPMWVRQRARTAQHIKATRREYVATETRVPKAYRQPDLRQRIAAARLALSSGGPPPRDD